jgi:pimeloyl-ACP methyl ester carboxylesterase
MSTEISNRTVSVWDGKIDLGVQVRGSGPALIYLHPAAGLAWDPFLERLAESYTVYAMEFPGTTPGDPYAIHQVDDIHDAVMIYDEALNGLGVENPVLMGQSFGGMLALELAAAYPSRFAKVIVLDPIGLWNENDPVVNWMEVGQEALPALLFKDPAGPAAQAAFAMPEDPELAVTVGAQLVWNLGCTGKLVWPIPDLGLDKRLHRVSADTLIVWGADDALISAKYADDLGGRIANSRVEIVADSGHIPQLEQTDVTYGLVSGFLGGG